MPVSKITSLWLACSASTVLAVVNIYQSVGGKMEKVHVMQVSDPDCYFVLLNNLDKSNQNPSFVVLCDWFNLIMIR